VLVSTNPTLSIMLDLERFGIAEVTIKSVYKLQHFQLKNNIIRNRNPIQII